MNKKIKVIVDDVELEVSVSEEELAKLTEKQKKTGYERATRERSYYTVIGTGVIDFEADYCLQKDNNRYEIANYYTDKTLAENNARADKLMRQLRRFAAENCEEVEWDRIKMHYTISYLQHTNELTTNFFQSRKDFGAIYFDTQENAEKAIDTFKDELIWYFTEYRDRV